MKNNMSQHGATLQTYNQELVKCLEELKSKRNQLLEIINKEQLEKNTVEKNMQVLNDKLTNINTRLQEHRALYDSYEKTIKETEFGFKKILESSQILLNLAQQEATKLHVHNKNSFSNKLSDES